MVAYARWLYNHICMLLRMDPRIAFCVNDQCAVFGVCIITRMSYLFALTMHSFHLISSHLISSISSHLISNSNSNSNNFIVSQYTFSIIHKYTKRLYHYIHKQFSESLQCYGSKGSWKSCWIYRLLVWYTLISFITTGVQGCRGCNSDNTFRQ